MSEEEATINPDGTQTMGEDAAADAGADYADAGGAAADDADDVDADAGEEDFAEAAEEAAEEVIKGTDPAIFLLLGFALIAALWFVSWYKKKKEEEESDSFFTELDGEKVSHSFVCLHAFSATVRGYVTGHMEDFRGIEHIMCLTKVVSYHDAWIRVHSDDIRCS